VEKFVFEFSHENISHVSPYKRSKVSASHLPPYLEFSSLHAEKFIAKSNIENIPEKPLWDL